MQVKRLIEILKNFKENEKIYFYHKNKNDLENKEIETILETDLGIEITIE